ncbi:MAG: hypothetical protein U0Y82_08160 [Thermoleophilia bacterium]
MFSVACPICGPVLMWESHIRSLETTPDGILVRYRCMCGYEGAMHTGRARGRATTKD